MGKDLAIRERIWGIGEDLINRGKIWRIGGELGESWDDLVNKGRYGALGEG